MKKNVCTVSRLIPKFSHTSLSENEWTLDDLFICLAGTIEDSLQTAGAMPVKDYNYLDLFKLAQPFALNCFQNKDRPVLFTVDWSDERD